MLKEFGHLFKFKEPPPRVAPTDPGVDLSAARIVLDFSESPYKVRLDDRLDALLSKAFNDNKMEQAAGIQCVRDFLRRDIEDARRSVNERSAG